jgi:hypothetical protein
MLSKASVVIPSARQKKMEVQRAERRAGANSHRDEVKLTARTENNDLVYLYTTHTVGYLVHASGTFSSFRNNLSSFRNNLSIFRNSLSSYRNNFLICINGSGRYFHSTKGSSISNRNSPVSYRKDFQTAKFLVELNELLFCYLCQYGSISISFPVL